jgi:hypothetical protein
MKESPTLKCGECGVRWDQSLCRALAQSVREFALGAKGQKLESFMPNHFIWK